MTDAPRTDSPVAIEPAGPRGINIEYAQRTLQMVHVSFDELDTISNLGASLEFSLLGISVGALVGFGTTLATVDIDSPYTFASFVALTAVAAGFSLFFGLRGFRVHQAAKRRIRSLKAAQVTSAYIR